MFTIANAAVHHLRAASDRIIKTSWGSMQERHAIFLGVQSESGHWGWGESWINFPTWAPWQRVASFQQAYLPYLKNKHVVDVQAFVSQMARDFLGPAVQAGVVGALVCELCAIEIALYDLQAITKRLPLNKMWFPTPAADVQIYASGINSPLPWPEIDALLQAGVRIFKLKVGFGDEDKPNIQALHKRLAPHHARIAIDTNRAWSFKEASRWLPFLRDHDILWLEEALKPSEEKYYPRLRDMNLVPLAAGENVWVAPGTPAATLADLPVHILQPDITKNCLPSAALDLLPLAAKQNKKVIPHYLGSAVGQAASIHLASGCDDALVEWDINPNPLRTNILGPDFKIQNGRIQIPSTPGLGWPVKISL